MLDEHDIKILPKDRETYGEDLFLAGFGRTVNTKPGELGRALDNRPRKGWLKELTKRSTARTDTPNFSHFQTNYLWLTTVQQNATCLNDNTYCVYSPTGSNCFGIQFFSMA